MASVCLRGRFEPGTKVSLFERVSDRFMGGQAEQTAVVSQASEVEFTGLKDGSPWWVVGGEPLREVQVTAKDQPKRNRLSSSETAEVLAGTRPDQRDREIVSGPRGSLTARALPRADVNERVRKATVRPDAHEPNKAKDREIEPAPRIKQADVPDSQPQRSDTPLGEGHPVDPWEIQPRVRQDQVSPQTPQMSATPLGEATPIVGHEVSPEVPQEDVGRRVKQRSDTPTGEAEIIPTGSPATPEEQAKVTRAAKAEIRREARKGDDDR